MTPDSGASGSQVFKAEYTLGNVPYFMLPLPGKMEWKFKIETSVGHILTSDKINNVLSFIVPGNTKSN